MAQVASERVVNGIKTRVLHGKDYVEVWERVNQIQHDTEAQGYSMLKQERYEWNGRSFFSIMIEVKGKSYIGDAEVTFDAPKNTPAGSSPVETAQTSALGRALAFAGYGTVESIASFDEIMRHQPGTVVIESSAQLPEPRAAEEEEQASVGQSGTLKAMLAKSQQRAFTLGMKKRHEWEVFRYETTGKESDADLVLADVAKLNGELTKREQEPAKAS